MSLLSFVLGKQIWTTVIIFFFIWFLLLPLTAYLNTVFSIFLSNFNQFQKCHQLALFFALLPTSGGSSPLVHFRDNISCLPFSASSVINDSLLLVSLKLKLYIFQFWLDLHHHFCTHSFYFSNSLSKHVRAYFRGRRPLSHF